MRIHSGWHVLSVAAALTILLFATSITNAEEVDTDRDEQVVERLEQLDADFRVEQKKGIVYVDFSRTEIENDDLKILKQIPHLEGLEIDRTPIGDDALKHVAPLSSLKQLDIEFTDISDEALSHLRKLKSLEQLDLEGTNIGGSGLKHLRKLKKLRELDLRETKVTRAEAKKLEEHLPRVRIKYGNNPGREPNENERESQNDPPETVPSPVPPPQVISKPAGEIDEPSHKYAIDAEAFRAVWQVDLQADNKPAIEIVSPLCQRLGLEIEATEEQRRLLEQPVSTRRKGVSRLQALELVLAEVGLYPEYPHGGANRKTTALKFGRLPCPRQRAFAGPFLVELREVEEQPPHATGRLNLWVFAGKLPPIVRWSLQEDTQWLTTIRHACSPDGRQLAADLHPGTSGWTFPDDSPLFQDHPHVELVDLLRDVEDIAHVEGVIRFTFPTKAETLEWQSAEEIREGESRQSDHFKVTIESAKAEGKSLSLKIQPQGGLELEQLDPVRIMAVDAAGESTVFARFRFGERANLSSGEPPTKLKVVAGLDTTTVSYPFTLKNIPLPAHEEQPVEIAPLRFDGDAPVTWRFIKFTQGALDNQDMEIELTNTSNRRVKKVELAMRYFDGDGKLLEEKSPTLSYTIDPGESLDQDLSFVSEKARSAVGEVVEVEFADLSVWKRDSDDADVSIAGRGQLWIDEPTDVRVGYVGFTTNGERLYDGCGFGDVDSWSNSITTGTFEPRTTNLTLARPKTCQWTHACTFRVTHLPEGTYLVYLQLADGPIAWRWIELNGDSVAKPIKLQLDMRSLDRVEVRLPQGAPSDNVRLIPLDDQGKLPIADAKLEKVNDYLKRRIAKPQVSNGVVSFDNLAPGRYRVAAGDWHKDVSVGQTN